MVHTGLDNEQEVALGPLGNLIGYHLRRASNVLSTEFARELEGTGMRRVPFSILSVVGANPGIHQGEVAKALGIQRANMVVLVNALEKEGLVARSVPAEDRRAFALTLTEAGTAMLDDCVAKIRANEQNTLAEMSDKERASLIALLTRITALER